MLLVVDANIFIAELLRRRGWDLLRDPRLTLGVSERAFEEARHEPPRRGDKIASQGRMTRESAAAVLETALEVVEEKPAVDRKPHTSP